ncbi:MAG: CHAT domain-containing protein, partial [Actinomycetota bacterium]
MSTPSSSSIPDSSGLSTRKRPWAARWATVTPRMAGPDLIDAEAEVAAVARLAGDCVALTGERASGTQVAAAMRGVAVAHLAAHGRFRVDNPLLSGIEL